MYRCHICGEIYEYPLCCPSCGERPVYDWMTDPELKKETDVNRDKETSDEEDETN